MLVNRTGYVQAVGVSEVRRVAVGSSQEQEDQLAAAECLVAQGHIFACDPVGELHRAVVAEKLLDRSGDR